MPLTKTNHNSPQIVRPDRIGGTERGREMPNIPTVPSGMKFSRGSVLKRLQSLKKKDSHVEGDPLPHLVRAMPELFAAPVTAIFNKASQEGKWPTRWKTEHITIIPKVRNPASLAETRNISCTPLLSKVLEGALLDQLRDELVPDPQQYGGLKACGAEHMLIDLWEKILEEMDDGKNGVVLLGVDFQKAFNRMEYAVCLEQLKKLGASNGSLAMVKLFLTGRRMRMKLGEAISREAIILRGSPQGSVLGGALYCATTQSLLQNDQAVPARRADAPSPPLREGNRTAWSHATLPSADHPFQLFPSQMSDSSDDGEDFWEPCDWDRSGEVELEIAEEAEKCEKDLGAVKYIDDTTLVQAISLDSATRHCTTSTMIEQLWPALLEARFDSLVWNANNIGMAINCAKTQLLCISPSNGCNTGASINTREGQVNSVETMKLVGFVFGKDPDVSAHVEHLVCKFRVKVWLLFHLREAGIKEERLFRLFCVYIRSTFEYCAPVYHSLLNRGQAETLERLQRHAARICFGTATPIRQVMAERGIQSLEERRVARVDRFIGKTVADPRFGPNWFPRRPADEHGIRDRRAFLERATKTVRCFNGPRNHFIRRANKMGLEA